MSSAYIYTATNNTAQRERRGDSSEREEEGGRERTRELKMTRFSSSGNVVETELKHALPITKK
jgi:hypothetical protein